MNDDNLRARIVAIAELFRDDLTDFGLYEVWPKVKYGLEIENDDKVKALTLEVVREMLRRGARVDFGDDLPPDAPSSGTRAEEVVARIAREWDELGRLPDMGEVCYIEYPKYDQIGAPEE